MDNRYSSMTQFLSYIKLRRQNHWAVCVLKVIPRPGRRTGDSCSTDFWANPGHLVEQPSEPHPPRGSDPFTLSRAGGAAQWEPVSLRWSPTLKHLSKRLRGFPSNFVHTFTVPRGWILLTLVIIRTFHIASGQIWICSVIWLMTKCQQNGATWRSQQSQLYFTVFRANYQMLPC